MARKTLTYAADFIGALRRDLAIVARPDAGFAWWLSRTDQGVLFFSERDRTLYGQVVRRLADDFAKAGDLSTRSVERFFQDAIFEALDLPGKESSSPEERLSRATAKLLSRLSTSPVAYRCLLQVDGFSVGELPLSFGGIRFLILGKSQLRQFGTKRARLGWPEPEDLGRPWALVPAKARDSDSALRQAGLRLNEALDSLNFIGGLVPYNYGSLRRPGDPSAARLTSAVAANDESFIVREMSGGPFGPFTLESLRRNRRASRLLGVLSSLCRSAGRRRESVGDILLASAGLSGRAMVEPKRELAFLLFAIALETAVLPATGQDLSYRLRLRVARLLGRQPERRKEIQNLVRDLYDVRSAIVHRGSYEVTDEHLGTLRSLTTAVLLRLLRRRSLLGAKAKALEEWWERLTLI